MSILPLTIPILQSYQIDSFDCYLEFSFFSATWILAMLIWQSLQFASSSLSIISVSVSDSIYL